MFIYSIKQMIQCQKDERRKYHISNQYHLKTILLTQLKKEFSSKDDVVVVVYSIQYLLILEMKSSHLHLKS